jgi:hypothetical protein
MVSIGRNASFITIVITVYKNVVLYGSEIWSFTLKAERGPRELEIRVLRRMFGPNRQEVSGEWNSIIMILIGLHVTITIGQLAYIKENEMGGVCSTHGGEDKFIQNFS